MIDRLTRRKGPLFCLQLVTSQNSHLTSQCDSGVFWAAEKRERNTRDARFTGSHPTRPYVDKLAPWRHVGVSAWSSVHQRGSTYRLQQTRISLAGIFTLSGTCGSGSPAKWDITVFIETQPTELVYSTTKVRLLTDFQ